MNRRNVIKNAAILMSATISAPMFAAEKRALHGPGVKDLPSEKNKHDMKNGNDFDVIIIGGSFAGLSAALTLGRAINRVC
jgi:hypothetical protein